MAVLPSEGDGCSDGFDGSLSTGSISQAKAGQGKKEGPDNRSVLRKSRFVVGRASSIVNGGCCGRLLLLVVASKFLVWELLACPGWYLVAPLCMVGNGCLCVID